jgi:hypothetical protein
MMISAARRRRRGFGRFWPCCCGCTTICVTVCGGIPVAGALVQIFTGATLVDSCTTGTTGCCQLCETGTYTLKVTIGGTLVHNATVTLAGGTITIAAGGSPPVVCCGAYAIPETLTLTDAEGSLTFGYDSGSFIPTWYGGHAVTRSSWTVTTPLGVCVSAGPTSGPVRVCYQMTCNAGSTPTFELVRSWSWVFEQGTITPAWYQDPSGFLPPGNPCATDPPVSCGIPHTDTSVDDEDPTTTSPFAISFTPVPSGGNFTADPIGGSVAIS